MTKSILDQDGWVEVFKENSQELASNRWNPFLEKNPRALIFFNPTNHRSMRLTKAGFLLLQKQIKLTYYEFVLVDKIKPKVLLQLERHIQYPYFIHSLSKIMVLDETTAIMLQLHGNDLETYLNNLEQHQ